MKRKPFPLRKEVQQKHLILPAFPTTTIGSFPQTNDVRSWSGDGEGKSRLNLYYYSYTRQYLHFTCSCGK